MIDTVLLSFQKHYNELEPVLLPHFTEYHGILLKHINAMKQSDTSGDSLEVCEIAHLARTQVQIIQKHEFTDSYKVTQRTPMHHYNVNDCELILLLYTPEQNRKAGHYESLMKRTSTSDLWTPTCESVFLSASIKDKKSVSLMDIVLCHS